jgi:LmbE family N-acetylglucosaminyl deacetylase
VYTDLSHTTTPSRRGFLAGLADVAGIARRAKAEGPASASLNVVVAGGHPGDPEYGCGGTIAQYAKLGHTVTLLYLNRGEDPHPDRTDCAPADAANDANVRVHEAMEACRILGARPIFAPQCNGNAIVDNAHYEAFTRLLSGLRADLLFTQWPIDNHPDHRAVSTLTLEAWNRLGRSAAFYFYEVSDGVDSVMFTPSEYVDITATEPIKREACYAHASQQPDYFYALQAQVAQFRGLEAGYQLAEGFVRHARSRRGFLP